MRSQFFTYYISISKIKVYLIAMAPHSSTLAWKIPWTEAPGRLTQLSDFTFTFHFRALEKEMATHSSVLAWRIPATGQPGGLPSMGSHRVGHDWSDLAAAADTYILCVQHKMVLVKEHHLQWCRLFIFHKSVNSSISPSSRSGYRLL